MESSIAIIQRVLANHTAQRPRDIEGSCCQGGVRRHLLTVLSLSLDFALDHDSDSMAEIADTLLQAQLGFCCDTAASFGGHVASVLFDRMVVCFGHQAEPDTEAARAAHAALQLAKEIAQRSLQLAATHRLTMAYRLGLHTGMAVVEQDGRPDGLTPGRAVRLEQQAAANTILLTSATRLILGDGFETAPFQRSSSEAALRPPIWRLLGPSCGAASVRAACTQAMPCNADEHETTQQGQWRKAGCSCQDLELEVAFSQDLERMWVSAMHDDARIRLGSRACFYLLFILGHGRWDGGSEKVRAALGTRDPEGWVETEAVLRAIGRDGGRSHLNIDVHRIRSAFHAAGVPGSLSIIERDAGRLRVGTAHGKLVAR